ncbi:acyl-CoA reductase [Fructobacillus sp. M2-14]|uniref:Acyl-CoA reductase n=1 Tax=Fructobacillus broussonetiae TaxID=2713173 RepID=A0ABS5QYV1_9LACO|nr:acyl-CoA reductase [Fructobacillus broussonetiae]MBS9338152.1 acyl-CoA reductase [Fructobacillus broussonetiae]
MNKTVTTIPVYHLPSVITGLEFEELTIENAHGSVKMVSPVLSTDLISKLVVSVKEKQRAYLKKQTTAQIIDVIGEAAEKWTDPNYHLRQLALKTLPIVTGYDASMIELELKRFIRLFRKKNLRRFVQSEIGLFGNVLDDFQPNASGGFSKFYGPDLIFQVFSGNVPGIQLWTLVTALLVKSPTIGKLTFAEAIMPSLFVSSLAEVDQELADSIALVPWRSEEGKALEEVAIEKADAIIVYGGEKTVNSIHEKVGPNKRVLTYGYKIGFAAIGKEALTTDRYPKLLDGLAADIALYDQQSCLAPQSVFIEEGGAVSPLEFTSMLKNALANFQSKHPRARLSENELMSIESARQKAEIEAFTGAETTVFKIEKNLDYTVVYHGRVGFEPSPLNRFINVFAVSSLDEILNVLTPYAQYLQSAGLAVAPKRLFRLADELGAVGVNRIAAIGEMNHVPSGWHHDGGFNLLDLVRVTDIEASAEYASESFDSDVE